MGYEHPSTTAYTHPSSRAYTHPSSNPYTHPSTGGGFDRITGGGENPLQAGHFIEILYPSHPFYNYLGSGKGKVINVGATGATVDYDDSGTHNSGGGISLTDEDVGWRRISSLPDLQYIPTASSIFDTDDFIQTDVPSSTSSVGNSSITDRDEGQTAKALYAMAYTTGSGNAVVGSLHEMDNIYTNVSGVDVVTLTSEDDTGNSLVAAVSDGMPNTNRGTGWEIVTWLPTGWSLVDSYPDGSAGRNNNRFEKIGNRVGPTIVHTFSSALPAGSYSITIDRDDSYSRSVKIFLPSSVTWNEASTSSQFSVANANVSPTGVTQCDFVSTSSLSWIRMEIANDGPRVEGIKLYKER